ncbi:hypothetical protein [Salinisphaera sp. G21_0]|uniref:hypothetical protein n=1 Tax=Salinisphaera sp. G21_0 TaxID=2821094 RepID=UPI001ADCA6A6|nr:hypothetical protein [Salinisphaera sp. G21_0]MBO9483630.1 hypothetical protein [Salinisphaera sp. G21_0]
MEVCQSLTNVANDSCPAIDQLQQKLTLLLQSNNPIQHFEDHGNEIHSLFVQAEREILDPDTQVTNSKWLVRLWLDAAIGNVPGQGKYGQ